MMLRGRFHEFNTAEILRPGAGRRAGMSLIELMLVILVIAILFAIMMPAIGMLRQRARRVDAEFTALALYDALIQYHFEYGRWPFDYSAYDSSNPQMIFVDDNYKVLEYLRPDPPDTSYNRKQIMFLDLEGDDYILSDEEPYNILDPWGQPYRIRIDTTVGEATKAVYVRSAGPNQIFEIPPCESDDISAPRYVCAANRHFCDQVP